MTMSCDDKGRVEDDATCDAPGQTVLVTHSAHFVRAGDGHVYAPNTLVARDFWSRYRAVFAHVLVVARVRSVEKALQCAARADGDGVAFCDLPDYTGPWAYLRVYKQMTALIRAAVERADVYTLRVPCSIGTLVWKAVRRVGRPYGLEVVGDPWESLAPGNVKSVARPIARHALARQLRKQCRHAPAVWYVTRALLQERYPPSPHALTEAFPNVELPPEAILDEPRMSFDRPNQLICVGTMAVMYKGQDMLLQALARIPRRDLHLTLVGDGRMRESIEALAAKLGVADRVSFAGMLPAGNAVRRALDEADLFVMPSRTEGLPRAMIEAMARALPAIGSRVGGIPELLPDEDLFPVDDVGALADKIVEILGDPVRYLAASKRNLESSRQYASTILFKRRTAYYQAVRGLRRTTP